MSRTTLDELLVGINGLSPQDRRQLVRLLKEQDQEEMAFAPVKDMAREASWLEEHRDEYAGLWVALDGDRLVVSGSNAKEVYAPAKTAGVADALIVKVESRDALPFAGF